MLWLEKPAALPAAAATVAASCRSYQLPARLASNCQHCVAFLHQYTTISPLTPSSPRIAMHLLCDPVDGYALTLDVLQSHHDDLLPSLVKPNCQPILTGRDV
jgi:hypothetical protein